VAMVGLMATGGYLDNKTCHFRALERRYTYYHLASGKGWGFLMCLNSYSDERVVWSYLI
jgi:hypothetical protein